MERLSWQLRKAKANSQQSTASKDLKPSIEQPGGTERSAD